MNKQSGRRWVFAGLMAVVAGTAGFAGSAVAQSHAMHGMSGHGGMSEAALNVHFDKMLAQMLPDGTPGQKTRLKAITKGVHADHRLVHAQFEQAHRRAHDLLLRPVVDRAGLEALRVEQVHQVDVLSKRVVGALADAAEVLTPEQRVRLAAHLKAAH